MGTRAKFRCEVVENYASSRKVKLVVVCDASANGENKNFTRYTPSGECWMTIDNPECGVQFEPGKHYYFDITEAPVDSNG